MANVRDLGIPADLQPEATIVESGPDPDYLAADQPVAGHRHSKLLGLDELVPVVDGIGVLGHVQPTILPAQSPVEKPRDQHLGQEIAIECVVAERAAALEHPRYLSNDLLQVVDVLQTVGTHHGIELPVADRELFGLSALIADAQAACGGMVPGGL
jgi:hypothetical protein